MTHAKTSSGIFEAESTASKKLILTLETLQDYESRHRQLNTLSDKISSDKIFDGQNILSDKIFDTKPKFRQFCPIFT